MSKMKDIAKEAGATLTVAALTVAAASTTSVYAEGNKKTAGQAGQEASGGLDKVNPGAETDLNGLIATIINMVGVIGIIAVIMIIIGGVNYTMSQGDSTKVQKAKNTILYGIIGLVVVLLAFAIVNFVLGSLNGPGE